MDWMAQPFAHISLQHGNVETLLPCQWNISFSKMFNTSVHNTTYIPNKLIQNCWNSCP